MLRSLIAALLTFGVAGFASAAVLMDKLGDYTIVDAPRPDGMASSPLDADGILEVLNAFAFDVGGAATDGGRGANIPAAFAGGIELAPGTTYLLSAGEPRDGGTAFTISEVPIPGAVLMFGTALAGLGLHRRLGLAD